MATVSINGQTEAVIKATGIPIKFQSTGSTAGMMEGCTKGIGWIIICMAMECINGRMVENTKGST